MLALSSFARLPTLRCSFPCSLMRPFSPGPSGPSGRGRCEPRLQLDPHRRPTRKDGARIPTAVRSSSPRARTHSHVPSGPPTPGRPTTVSGAEVPRTESTPSAVQEPSSHRVNRSATQVIVRVPVDVEEPRLAQVGVPCGDAGVEALQVQLGADPHRRAVGGELDAPPPAGHRPVRGAAEAADGEADPGAAVRDGPDAGQGQCLLRGGHDRTARGTSARTTRPSSMRS